LAKEDKEKEGKEDDVEDEMKNMLEKKKKQFVKLYNALIVCF